MRSDLLVVSLLAGFSLGCGAGVGSGGRESIEATLYEDGLVRVMAGGRVDVRDDRQLKALETAGLVSLRAIEMTGADVIFLYSQGVRRFYVAPTAKLVNMAVECENAKDECMFAVTEAPVSDALRPFTVKISEPRVISVVSDDEYSGALATPGEKYRIVLGTYRRVPTANANANPTWKVPEEIFRFRAVMRFSVFTKEWSVLALDGGFIDREDWWTDNVK